MKTKQDARERLREFGVPLDQNYFSLTFDQCDSCEQAAKKHGYRKSKNANGSRARMFYEYANR